MVLLVLLHALKVLMPIPLRISVLLVRSHVNYVMVLDPLSVLPVILVCT